MSLTLYELLKQARARIEDAEKAAVLLAKDIEAAGAVKASLMKERDTVVGQLHDERDRLSSLRARIGEIIEKVAVATGKTHALTIEAAVNLLLEERASLIRDAAPRITKTPAPTLAALMLVAEERARQNEKWEREPGKWEAADGTKLAVLVEEVGEVATELQSYDAIDAIDERLRAELAQVAAVAVAWIEHIDNVASRS